MKDTILRMFRFLGLYPLLKSIYRSLNFRQTIRINRKKFRVLHLYGSVCKVQETWMVQVMQLILKIKSGKILDVGMNLGQTLIEAKSIDPEIEYVGIEPNPSCIFYVEELVRINKFKNCRIVPVGLYFCDALLTLNLYEDNLTNSGGSIIKDFWSYKNYNVRRSLIVPVLSFETINRSLGISDFQIIKIDVEGAELEVLQTLYGEIQKTKPIIIIEILSAYSEKNILRFERQKQIEEFLKKIDYKIIMLFENNKGKLSHLREIETFDVNANPNDCNYIFYPAKDKSTVESVFESFLQKPE
jgi:FkbM family methyltransferase